MLQYCSELPATAHYSAFNGCATEVPAMLRSVLRVAWDRPHTSPGLS
jgi:hypothetical protein